jgi:hypothetical protein
MATRDVVCPHCGYDFPEEPHSAADVRGIEYSKWADVALLIGAIVASLFCVGTAVGSVIAIFSGEFVQGLIAGSLSFFLALAMLVVFLRVRKL